MLFIKNDDFFMKQYMVQAVLSLNEVYQMYLKKQRKNKIDLEESYWESLKGQCSSNHNSHTWPEST